MNLDYLNYLTSPQSLVKDLPKLRQCDKIILIKQFLSKSEFHDKRSSTVIPDENYSKSQILDILALTIMADFKYNINVLIEFCELPVKLVARLFDIFVSISLKSIEGDNSKSASDENSYTVYSKFLIDALAMCISAQNSVITKSTKFLIPFVSGLTEIPDDVFYIDSKNHVENIFASIPNSLNSIHDLLKTEDSIEIARPKFGFFHFNENNILEPKLTDETVDIISASYMKASCHFLLGRFYFTQCDFKNSMNHFELCYNLIRKNTFDTLVEVGCTVSLLDWYQRANFSFFPEKILLQPTMEDFSIKTISSLEVFLQKFYQTFLNEPKEMLITPVILETFEKDIINLLLEEGIYSNNTVSVFFLLQRLSNKYKRFKLNNGTENKSFEKIFSKFTESLQTEIRFLRKGINPERLEMLSKNMIIESVDILEKYFYNRKVEIANLVYSYEITSEGKTFKTNLFINEIAKRTTFEIDMLILKEPMLPVTEFRPNVNTCSNSKEVNFIFEGTIHFLSNYSKQFKPSSSTFQNTISSIDIDLRKPLMALPPPIVQNAYEKMYHTDSFEDLVSSIKILLQTVNNDLKEFYAIFFLYSFHEKIMDWFTSYLGKTENHVKVENFNFDQLLDLVLILRVYEKSTPLQPTNLELYLWRNIDAIRNRNDSWFLSAINLVYTISMFLHSLKGTYLGNVSEKEMLSIAESAINQSFSMQSLDRSKSLLTLTQDLVVYSCLLLIKNKPGNSSFAGVTIPKSFSMKVILFPGLFIEASYSLMNYCQGHLKMTTEKIKTNQENDIGKFIHKLVNIIQRYLQHSSDSPTNFDNMVNIFEEILHSVDKLPNLINLLSIMVLSVYASWLHIKYPAYYRLPSESLYFEVDHQQSRSESYQSTSNPASPDPMYDSPESPTKHEKIIDEGISMKKWKLYLNKFFTKELLNSSVWSKESKVKSMPEPYNSSELITDTKFFQRILDSCLKKYPHHYDWLVWSSYCRLIQSSHCENILSTLVNNSSLVDDKTDPHQSKTLNSTPDAYTFSSDYADIAKNILGACYFVSFGFTYGNHLSLIDDTIWIILILVLNQMQHFTEAFLVIQCIRDERKRSILIDWCIRLKSGLEIPFPHHLLITNGVDNRSMNQVKYCSVNMNNIELVSNEFIWDVDFLETLIQSENLSNSKRTNLLNGMSQSQMNQFNSTEMQQSLENCRKTNLLLHLARLFSA